MSRSTKGTCRGCDAEMVWAVTEAGKGVPLDPDPHPEGNLVAAGTHADGRMIVRYLRKGEETTEPRYRTHFATCPEAESFRRDR